jgi:hypothetical protein
MGNIRASSYTLKKNVLEQHPNHCQVGKKTLADIHMVRVLGHRLLVSGTTVKGYPQSFLDVVIALSKLLVYGFHFLNQALYGFM